MSFRFQALTQPKLTQPNEPKKLHIIFFQEKETVVELNQVKFISLFHH